MKSQSQNKEVKKESNQRIIKSSHGKIKAKHHVICDKPITVPQDYETNLMGDLEYIKVATLNPQKRKLERLHIFRKAEKQKYKSKKLLKDKYEEHEQEKEENRNNMLRRINKYK